MPSPTHPIASSAPAKSKHQQDTDTTDSGSGLINNVTQGDRLPINRVVLFLFLAIAGLVLDLATKSYMFEHYFEPELMFTGRYQEKHWWIEGVFGIQCSTNPGALFGFGKGYSFVFAIISVVAVAGIVTWLFVYKQALDRWMNFALGMITGGIIGNMYDRLGFGYQTDYPIEIKDNVRDWILFELDGVPFFDPWPNFNIADSLLVTGAILLFLHAIFVPVNAESDSAGEDANRDD